MHACMHARTVFLSDHVQGGIFGKPAHHYFICYCNSSSCGNTRWTIVHDYYNIVFQYQSAIIITIMKLNYSDMNFGRCTAPNAISSHADVVVLIVEQSIKLYGHVSSMKDGHRIGY